MDGTVLKYAYLQNTVKSNEICMIQSIEQEIQRDKISERCAHMRTRARDKRDFP